MALTEKLKQLRSGTKESLQELADAVGVSKAHVWELETGRSQNPSLDILQKLAGHFGVTISYLVGEAEIEKARADHFFRKNSGKIEEMSETDLALLQGFLERFSEKK